MNETVIMPCPMCGEPRRLKAEEADTPPRWWKWSVVCEKDGCEQEPVQVIPEGIS